VNLQTCIHQTKHDEIRTFARPVHVPLERRYEHIANPSIPESQPTSLPDMDSQVAQVKVNFTTTHDDLQLPEEKRQLIVPAGMRRL
jgi:hypothetical protein